MTSHSDVANNFFEGKKSRGCNMYSSMDGEYLRLYSYGSHFPLAIKLNKPHPNVEYLLNGDKYSVSTSKHQTITQGACKWGNVIIPFSALNQLGFNGDLENLIVIDKTNDQTREIPYIDPETKEHKTRIEHLLGSTLFRIGRKYYLSSIDDSAKNWGMGYFLVQLPKPCKTVNDAYAMLKPKEVKEDTPYIRQGEFFFIPKPELTTKQLKGMKPKIFKTKKDKIEHQKVFYLWDNNKLHKTVLINNKKDYDTIVNENITLEKWHKDITQYLNDLHNDHIRNGKDSIYESVGHEWNNNKTELTVWAKEIKKSYNKYTQKGIVLKSMNIAQYLNKGDSGNAHIVRDMILFKGKEIYVRGSVRHPEHKMINLGETWHKVYINNAVMSINVVGNVD